MSDRPPPPPQPTIENINYDVRSQNPETGEWEIHSWDDVVAARRAREAANAAKAKENNNESTA